jgi:hypothetical protein
MHTRYDIGTSCFCALSHKILYDGVSRKDSEPLCSFLTQAAALHHQALDRDKILQD